MLKYKCINMLLFMAMAATGSVLAADNSGGFSLGKTRVIYEANQPEANILVINSASNSAFLAQSWISNIADNDQTKPPFIVTPPLYRQDEGKNLLRITRNGGNLPKDRESAYFLNVKAIPAVKKDEVINKNLVQFAYVLRVKIFYRPDGLEVSPEEAYKKVQFSTSANTLIAKNPTPYYISFNKITVGGVEVANTSTMVPPFGQQNYPTKVTSGKVIYSVMTDAGSASEAISAGL